jgi:DNA-binding NarL/FixJ family response regulator
MTKAAKRIYRVLIVEDHPVVVAGVTDALHDNDAFEVIGNVSSEAEAVRAAAELGPDIAIVDMMLKKGTGLGAIKLLTEEHPAIRVLVYTMHDEALYAERAMRAGAHGYVNKSATADELVAALRDVASGKMAISGVLNEKLLQKAIGNAGSENGVESLSDRELEVFEQIGGGLPLRDIAENLGISVKTVETHRENIKKKLDLSSATELARFAVAWVENPG